MFVLIVCVCFDCLFVFVCVCLFVFVCVCLFVCLFVDIYLCEWARVYPHVRCVWKCVRAFVCM